MAERTWRLARVVMTLAMGVARDLGPRFPIVLAVACAMSCASPTLPLPPPGAPSINATSTGIYHLVSMGGAEPNAVIVIVNRDTGLPLDKRVAGSIADGHGSWDADVSASPGDVLDITQDFDNAESPSTTVQIPNP